MKKFLLYIISTSTVILLILYFFFDSLITKSSPNYNDEFSEKSISSEVSVYRDSYGIPTVSAIKSNDLYFAWGYTQAQDRIFQMDLLRRMGEGRLSEIYGSQTINTDIFYRTIRLNSISEKQFENMSVDEKNILKAYSKGVNYFIESNKNKLPIEFSILNYKPETWTESNSLLIFNMFQWWMDQNPDGLLNELFVSDSATHTFFKKENSFLLDYFKNEKSTTVIIPSKHSLSAKPLFYSEISGNLTVPSKYYEFFLDFSGLSSGGISLPGVPVILSGVSSSQAWSFSSFATSKKIELIIDQNLKPEKYPEVITVRDEESINLVIQEYEGKINVSDLIMHIEENNIFLTWKPDNSFFNLVKLSENKQISESDHLIVLNQAGETNQPKIQNPNQSILILQNGHTPYKPDFRGKADSVDAAWMTYFLNDKLLGSSDLKSASEIPDFNYSMKIKSVLLQHLFSDSTESGMTAKKYLKVWRADFTKQDIGASVISVWNYLFAKHCFGEKFREFSKKEFQESTLYFLSNRHDADSIVFKSMGEAIHILKNRFGDDPVNWRWGNLNLLEFNSLFLEFADETEKIKMDNTGYNFIYEINKDNNIIMKKAGKQFVIFSDFQNNNYVNIIVPGGINGQFGSMNFSDQLTLFNSHQFLNIDISGFKNSKYKLTIRPEK